MLSKTSLLITLALLPVLLVALPQPEEEVPVSVEGNKDCLKCHGSRFYTYFNEYTERTVKDRMNPYFIIDSAIYYKSNHRNFNCTDCHSGEFQTFPHPGHLRMEPAFACMDCHGGDPTFAQYLFERIEEEFNASVHSTKHDEEFTCWMCHNPHSYHISARRENIPDVVAYDNEICLTCHANVNKFQLLTEKENPSILEKHDWLPNQKLHFTKVRCIECHAEHQNDILVAHNIKPKEKGFFSATDLEWETAAGTMGLSGEEGSENNPGGGSAQNVTLPFIIGSGSNPMLNLVSMLLFFAGILVVLIHATLRIIYKTS